MTSERDIERLLDAWLSEGPTQVADRVIDDVAARVAHQPQRPAWRLRPWRFPTMTLSIRLAGAALAVVLAIAGITIFALPRSSGPNGTLPSLAPTLTPAASSTAAATPSSPPSPSPTAAAYTCDDPAYRCAGLLTAGPISTAAFRPRLAFTIPAGWANSLDRERSYNLKPVDNLTYFQVLSQNAIPEQNGACTAERKAGAKTTVAAFVQFYTSHPGLVATAPVPITVGGYAGQRVTVHVKATWTATCPGSIAPAVVLLTDTVTAPDRVIWIDDQYTTLWIFDVAGTTVVARVESGPSADAAARDQQRVQPIIDSFVFSLSN
jgi:hypothetical protein